MRTYRRRRRRSVRIISEKRLDEFVRKHAQAKAGLATWRRVAKAANRESLQGVRAVWSSADAVGVYTVFNIGGNKYRLIARVEYEHQSIYIHEFLTHGEYDKDRWK